MIINKEKGFSLIELMITSTIGLFLLTAALGIYISIVKSNTQNIKNIYLAESLRTAQSLITSDVKRIGYWPSTSMVPWFNTTISLSSMTTGIATATDLNGTGLFGSMGSDVVNLQLVGKNGKATITQYTDSNNIQINITQPFDSTNLSGGTWTFINPFTLIYPTTATPVTCILFTYSLDNDNTVDTNERIGYRLNNNAIEMFQSGVFSCNQGTWEAITSPTTKVTNLQFTLHNDTLDIDGDAGPGTSNIISRALDITMTAEESSDPAMKLTLASTVKISNDVFVP